MIVIIVDHSLVHNSTMILMHKIVNLIIYNLLVNLDNLFFPNDLFVLLNTNIKLK